MDFLKDAASILAKTVSSNRVASGVTFLALIVAGVVTIAFSKILWALVALIVVVFIAMAIIIWSDRPDKAPEPLNVPFDTCSLAALLTKPEALEMGHVMRGIVIDVSNSVGVSSNQVRSNLFGRSHDGRLRMITDFCHNMNRPEELTLSMEIGQGSNGRAYLTGRANFARLREDWGKDAIDDEELRKAHPDLKWIISMPICASPGGTPIWILNVDGLEGEPSDDQLMQAMAHMTYWCQFAHDTAVKALGRKGA